MIAVQGEEVPKHNSYPKEQLWTETPGPKLPHLCPRDGCSRHRPDLASRLLDVLQMLKRVPRRGPMLMTGSLKATLSTSAVST